MLLPVTFCGLFHVYNGQKVLLKISDHFFGSAASVRNVNKQLFRSFSREFEKSFVNLDLLKEVTKESNKALRGYRWVVLFFVFVHQTVYKALPLPPAAGSQVHGRKPSALLNAINYVALLLLQSGDIEENPGPIDSVQTGAPRDVNGANDVNDVDGVNGANERISKDKSDLQVISLNVRGLGDKKKARHLINTCYKRCNLAVNSIFLFQESFVPRFDLLNYLWRGEHHLTPGTGASKGCLTLVTAPYKIIRAVDIGDRAHVLVLTKDNPNKAELIVANAYAPNGLDNTKLDFFRELTDKLLDLRTDYNCGTVLLGGDLNLVFADYEVRNRLFSVNEQRMASLVRQMFDNLNLTDGWDEASKRDFTWTSNRTGQPSYSTLDRILYTNGLQLRDKISDWSMSLSDHAAVIAFFKKPTLRPNTSALPSRLDPRILLDPDGRRELEMAFRELVNQVPPNWNPHVRLEFLKMSIRTASNQANGKIKAGLRDDEIILNTDINEVVTELMRQDLERERKELLMNKLDDLRQLKRNLIEKIGTKLEQRTARKWYNEGELSNKYFFNLLNRRTNDNISTLLNDQGDEINDPSLIESTIRDFYKDLYESVSDDLETENDNEFFRNVRPVPDDAAAQMQTPVTLEELTETLKTCNDTAPGPDGIPYSFLKHFWQDFGPALVKAWEHSLR